MKVVVVAPTLVHFTTMHLRPVGLSCSVVRHLSIQGMRKDSSQIKTGISWPNGSTAVKMKTLDVFRWSAALVTK